MILRSHGGNIQLRAGDDPANDPNPPAPGMDGMTTAGVSVSHRQAVGLPAVLNVIALASWTAAQLPCTVNRIQGTSVIPATDAEQYRILHTSPAGASTTPMQMWWTVISSIMGHGGAGLLKLKARGKVVGLIPQSPQRFTPFRRDGELLFRFRDKYGKGVDLTRDDIIYIPGDLFFDTEIGVSPLTVARETMGISRAQQQFEGRWYTSDGSPGDLVTFPGTPTPAQRTEFAESWTARHKPGTRGLGMLWGGMTHESVTVSLADAQYAEAAKLSERRAAQIFTMPVGMVDPDNDQMPDQTHKRFTELFLAPKLEAIVQALHADNDLFPDKSLKPKFISNALLRPSLKDRADAYRLFRQGGIMTANEIRPMEDLPPHEDGNVLQVTPVGGGANPGLTPTQAAPGAVSDTQP